MIFNKTEVDFIIEAFIVSMAELRAQGKTAELDYITERVKEANKLVDNPNEYLNHLLVTFEYIQEVINE